MNKPKIAVLGEGYLSGAFDKNQVTIIGKNRITFSSAENTDFITERLNTVLGEFDIIINCIAKSNTRYCENNFDDAMYVNAIVPRILKYYCIKYNKKLVHISTGCLYDVNDIPQKETDFLASHCNYTLTKWIGEKGADFSNCLIIRPRLFFDNSNNPKNLLNKIRKFDKLCGKLDSISSTTVVVDAIMALLKQNAVGTFNVACDGFISMYQIGALLGLNKPMVNIEDVRREQGLYLVNNTMDISKLKQYYTPPNIVDEILRCAKK